MASTPATAPNPSAIFGTLRAFQDSAVLGSAIDLEIFTAIAEGSVTASQIAAKSGASERGIRILCDNLVTTGMLTKQGDRYGNTQDTQIFLNRHSPAYIGGVKEFLCGPMMMVELFENLTNSIRRGGTSLPGEGSVNPDNPIWVTFARAMAPMMVPAAHAIASHMPASGPLKVLDIAAGHGMFGITIAQRNPEAQIVALDWKAVLEVATENAAKAGVDGRYSTIAGSAFDVDFGASYDVVLVTNFLHHFDAPTNEALLRKVHAALKPGGKAITLEFVPNDDRVTPPLAARFSLTMLSTTQRGDAYTFRELEAMYRNAGFSASVQHLLETQQSVIISTK
jgi:ubiquinone/menaquinone biosynthesis C-methylase UbiE